MPAPLFETAFRYNFRIPPTRGKMIDTSLSKDNLTPWREDPDLVVMEPAECDVLCGRGKTAFQHAGNMWLRLKIAKAVQEFEQCKSRVEKTKLVRSIVKDVLNRGGRFLKRDCRDDEWYLAGYTDAREKVAHALRDASSNKVKCMKEIRRCLVKSEPAIVRSTVLHKTETIHKDKDTVSRIPQSCSTIPSFEDLLRTLDDEDENTSSNNCDMDVVALLLQPLPLREAPTRPNVVETADVVVVVRGGCEPEVAQQAAGEQEKRKGSIILDEYNELWLQYLESSSAVEDLEDPDTALDDLLGKAMAISCGSSQAFATCP